MSLLLISPSGEQLEASVPLGVALEPGHGDRSHHGQTTLRFQAFDGANRPVANLPVKFTLSTATDVAETEFQTLKVGSVNTHDDGQLTASISLDLQALDFWHRRLFVEAVIDGHREQLTLQFVTKIPNPAEALPAEKEADEIDLDIDDLTYGDPDDGAVPEFVEHPSSDDGAISEEPTQLYPIPAYTRKDLEEQARRTPHPNTPLVCIPDLPVPVPVPRFDSAVKTPRPVLFPSGWDKGHGIDQGKVLSEELIQWLCGQDPAVLRARYDSLMRRMEEGTVELFERRAKRIERVADDAVAKVTATMEQAERDFGEHIKNATGRSEWSFGSANNLTLSLVLAMLSLGALALVFFL